MSGWPGCTGCWRPARSCAPARWRWWWRGWRARCRRWSPGWSTGRSWQCRPASATGSASAGSPPCSPCWPPARPGWRWSTSTTGSARRWRRPASTRCATMADAADALRGQHLHIDGASGAAGDMVLGALLHLGVPRELVDEAFDRIGLGRNRLVANRVVKHGLAAVNATILVDDEHEHEHGHQHVRHAEIATRLSAAGLAPEVLERALDIFRRLAEAEAALHGVAESEVEFHEVGAIDSIADVVGAAVGLAWLAPASVTASPVALGHGTVRSAHGLLPVPAPAALEILRRAGAAVEDGGAARELCT